MTIMRSDLAQFFGSNPRLLRSFEQQAEDVEATKEGLSTTATATKTLQDAGVLVLAPNEEFQNERVLKVGRGLRAVDKDGELTLSTADTVPILNGGFTMTMTLEGNANVAVPLTGILATTGNIETFTNKTLHQPKVAGLGDYVDDAAAAAGGVPVGGLYRTASALKLRVA